MKIVLTGFMGTGKTSVGRALSRYLGYEFIDTDVLIEEREGMTISAIFKKHGEGYFRGVEKAVVKEVSQLRNAVIATGGGVIKDSDNVGNLRKGGILVWLKADPGIILKRVMTEGGKRPLLEVEEPLEEIRKLLDERLPLYRQADASVDTNYITPEEAAGRIVEKLCLGVQNITVDLGERSYDILVGSSVLRRIGIRVKEFRPTRVAVISNKTVYPLFRDTVLRSLREYNIVPEIILVPDGEEYKDFIWVQHIYGELLKARFDRNSLIIALGGGVIGDMAGFVAATYMRGIRFIQVPTTLLAQVDSSVGGKTGVNHPLGKNMIGAFYQPSLVIIDTETLKTLPHNEFNAGMAEVIKYGVIADGDFFDYLKENRDGIMALEEDKLTHIIRRSCEIKALIVSKDEREAGLRAVLNYGHTAGHAIETVTGYKRFLHGEAVAAGMYVAARIAVVLGILTEGEAGQIKEIIEMYKLPAKLNDVPGADDLVGAMEIDKKASGGRLIFVLPESIGKVRLEKDVDRDLIKEVLKKT